MERILYPLRKRTLLCGRRKPEPRQGRLRVVLLGGHSGVFIRCGRDRPLLWNRGRQAVPDEQRSGRRARKPADARIFGRRTADSVGMALQARSPGPSNMAQDAEQARLRRSAQTIYAWRYGDLFAHRKRLRREKWTRQTFTLEPRTAGCAG